MNVKYRYSIIIGVLTAIFTLVGLITGICILVDKKKKKEDEELEDYLENVIQ